MTTDKTRKAAQASKIKQRLAEAQSLRETAPIIPHDNVAGRALIAVVTIMTFLAALTVGSITLVREAAIHWRSNLAQEISIQIRVNDKKNIETETAKVVSILKKTDGLNDVRVLNAQETATLLEPWLGRGLDLGTLPIPKVIAAKLEAGANTDLSKLRAALKDQVPEATLDDHRGWAARLSSVSDGILLAGTSILLLVIAATVLCVTFATRSAVNGSRAIVEVLHFVGARDSNIAGVFQRHFLLAGLKGALMGGGLAAALFSVASFAPDLFKAPDANNSEALFGKLTMNVTGYLGIAAVILLVVAITTLASRYTVHRTIRSID